MMLLWCMMLILGATCSDEKEIPLARAEQSSTDRYDASCTIDNNINSASYTHAEVTSWLRVYFTSSSTVGRVVVEKYTSHSAACVWTVSVYDGETGTVCGTYTDKQDGG